MCSYFVPDLLSPPPPPRSGIQLNPRKFFSLLSISQSLFSVTFFSLFTVCTLNIFFLMNIEVNQLSFDLCLEALIVLYV